MSRLLIRNGRVIDPTQSIDQGMDILLEEGLVASLGERLPVPDQTEVFDAAGLVVAPGFIDARTFLGEPGCEQQETISSGCQAAVAGGYTAVCCLPRTDPVVDGPAAVRFIVERGVEVGLCRVYPFGSLSVGQQGESLAEIGEMAREGAVAVTDDNPVRSSQLLRRALEYTRSFDLPVLQLPEDAELAGKGSMHEGEVATRIGLPGIPTAAESTMVARDLILGQLSGGKLHLGPLSSKEGLDLVAGAKSRGVQVTCEVTPHHFTLSDVDLERANYDPNWKVRPPLRTPADVEAVKERIYDSTVDIIVSDHSPQLNDMKELDFALAPFGAVGLETTVSLAIDRLVHAKVIGLIQLVRLLSSRPAEIFGLPGGTLRPGSPADLTLLDLRRWRTIDPSLFRSKSHNTPFNGMRLRGCPVATIVGGRVIWQAG